VDKILLRLTRPHLLEERSYPTWVLKPIACARSDKLRGAQTHFHSAGTMASDGNFYGTTSGGGAPVLTLIVAPTRYFFTLYMITGP
jgi:hypothetical protein